ncbi:MAG: murein biosynthesis integral membrane protein MurJ [Elusimicrobia bacterium RIFCSPLOWO2_01_FULL_59_12]|nr:MAG: murein biosynthesis integral membrane protein MurJ [Elusimicrobia bacterium RIFCSPLOWO2_01_FULL_59_12]
MLSRILGYVRDSLVANFFGAGLAADAFYAAFRISNLFRRLLGEGALSASFIPVFSEYAEKHGKEKTQRFFSVMFTTLLALLVALTALGVMFAPQITRVIAMGFERTPERFDLTVTLTRYMFPFLLFISLAALLTGVLNAFHSFFLPALAPAALSVVEIVYLLAVAPFVSPVQQVIGLAVSVAIGGFIQWVIQIPALLKKGYRLMFGWDLRHEGVLRVEKLMLPATIGISVDQLNAFVDTMIASFLQQGSVTALYYSNRVMQLPLALFGIALSQVALPAMSASVARGDAVQIKDTLNFSLRLTLFMIIPAMAGLMFLGAPIVKVLFEHGQFTPEATEMTSRAMLFFSLGLFAYAAVKILASAFYAHQNTRVPVAVAAVCVGLNIVLSLALMRRMGVGGLALATAVASWVNAALLFYLLRRKIGLLGGRRILTCLLKACAASLGMIGFCHLVMTARGPFHLIVRLAVAIAGGGLVYLGLARGLRMEEWGPFWSILSRAHPVEAD